MLPDFNLYFLYNDGKLFWKQKVSDKVTIGKQAGSYGGKYGLVKLFNKGYYIHKVVYYMFYGTWPKLIDHINGNQTDNRIENLRSATYSLNNRNRGKQPRKKSTSKYKGVFWSEKRKSWIVRASINNKPFHIGQSKSEEDAAKMYDKFIIENFKEPMYLNFKGEIK